MEKFKPKSAFLETMIRRGYWNQCTDPEALDALMQIPGQYAYIGFDLTAPSLHAGSLVQLMMLRWLQKTGHNPIILLGGGTTQIGDPSGKDTQRRIMSRTDIENNKKRIHRLLKRWLALPPEQIIDNAEWLNALGYVELLREVGTHFSVNRMLSFDSVRSRLQREQTMSFLEFNYMILQAYDFRELSRRYGCRLQIGGSDQWGNIVCGAELTRRTDGTMLFGLTSPLLETASGKKMGKSEAGAVWLDDSLFSVWDFWQYWRNCDDADIARFLYLFTELPETEIARLQNLQGSERNEAKIILATEVTACIHGRTAAEKARQGAHALFVNKQALGDFIPRMALPCAWLEADMPIAELFMRAGLTKSKGETRRLIRNKGIKINDRLVADDAETLRGFIGVGEKETRLSVGRKTHKIIEWKKSAHRD